MNKKVINATAVSQDGINFRSKSERTMYNLLKESGLKFWYESEPITLLEGFYPLPWYEGTKEHTEKIRKMTYTPDFIVEKNNHHFVLEVKGMPTDRYVVKRKLFLNYLKTQPTWHFFEVHTKRDMIFCIQKIKDNHTDKRGYQTVNLMVGDDGGDQHPDNIHHNNICFTESQLPESKADGGSKNNHGNALNHIGNVQQIFRSFSRFCHPVILFHYSSLCSFLFSSAV